ncbi:TIGR01906 family membrane protein [Lacrimispora sp.]|uniref:TIGR01906 family membrane protein n=1 Tax=Lacrimispora sp. TaxID=2719234 RepID=UPI0032E4D5A5|nr:TIGR01906 family membrane protein [Paenibacillaceae bacterium]
MNRFLQYTFGIIFSICLMVVLLFTAVEAAVYWTPGYFEKEYKKYNVTESVSMKMDDLMDVTNQMMAYLKGNRTELQVNTTMGGVRRDFFSAREIAHMEDVQGLFLGAMSIRRGCLMVMVLCLIILMLLKISWNNTFPRSVLIGSGLFFLGSAVIAGIISSDFTKYFIMFHHMFFTNDFWMLDPSTDMLINIVPEGFFRDTVFYIGFLYFFSVVILLALCVFLMRKKGKNSK